MDFDLLSIQGLLCAFAYFFAGIVDSVCGGGGLITVPVMIMTGIPTHFITGTNQCSACLGAFAATYKYIKEHKIHLRSAIFTLPFAIIGSFLGAKLNLLVPEKYLETFMLVMVPIIAIFMIVNKKTGEEDHIDELSKGTISVRSSLIGLILGTYQGFYGPGGGMFFMLAYAIFLKLSLVRATGNTRTVVGMATLISTITYAFSGNVLWKLAFLATIFNVIGSYIGAILAIKKGSKIIRPIMFGVVAVLFVKILLKI